MAKIFISHSKADTDIKNFFMSAITPTDVRAIFEELEKALPAGITADKIEQDINASNALFVLLSENVEKLQHTRDWVTWECGKATNKEVWVFEPVSAHGKISVVVPKINHYVIYDDSEDWRVYIRSIVENHDDSKVLPTLLATAATGAAINNKDRVSGAIGGVTVGVLGLLLQAATKPSLGFEMRCYKCWSVYRLHKGGFGEFRCPVCNNNLVLQ